MPVTKASTGLLYEDGFAYSDGVFLPNANWENMLFGTTMTIVSEVLKSDPADSSHVNYVKVKDTVVPDQQDVVVQCKVTISGNNFLGGVVIARVVGSSSYILTLAGTPGEIVLVETLGGAVKNFFYGVWATVIATPYVIKLWVRDDRQIAWVDETGVIDVNGFYLNGFSGSVACGKSVGGGHFVGDFTTSDNFVVYTSNIITFNDIPVGFKARVNGHVTASDGVNPTLVDIEGTTCPYANVEILTPSDSLIATFAPGDGVYGGDEYDVELEVITSPIAPVCEPATMPFRRNKFDPLAEPEYA